MTGEWQTSGSNYWLLNLLGPVYPAIRAGKPSLFWGSTPAWMNASSQFDYFSDASNGYISGEVIDIRKGSFSSGKGGTNVRYSELSERLPYLGIQAGDIMYFYNQEEGVHHATVITKAEDAEIYYAGNSLNRFDRPLTGAVEEVGGVVIVRLR